jgi:hypothetical protein
MRTVLYFVAPVPTSLLIDSISALALVSVRRVPQLVVQRVQLAVQQSAEQIARGRQPPSGTLRPLQQRHTERILDNMQ